MFHGSVPQFKEEKMEAQYQYIIFDLDGTLVKSEEGLYDSITYALEKSGVHPGDRKDMKRCSKLFGMQAEYFLL